MQSSDFQFVSYLWDEAKASNLDPVGRLVYRSNLLGSDQRITNTGGGNTSAKIEAKDPLTGETVEVLWVKGSGGDLRTSKKENFASLYQNKLQELQKKYLAATVKGPKTAMEDAMVAAYPHCTFNLNPRASSIDTPLHSFVPYKHVDHTHPNAVIAIAASKNGRKLTQEIYGEEVLWTPWQRPGFDLGIHLQEICRKHPKAKGVILGQHGLINWANDDLECYELTLRLIEKAARYIDEKYQAQGGHSKAFGGPKYPPEKELDASKRLALLARILPWLRGKISTPQHRWIATVQTDETALRFVNSHDALRLAELGTSCPDHFLRTKIKPLYVDWDPATNDEELLQRQIIAGLETYRADYANYYERCKAANSPAMRNPNPTVILIPGLGLIAWGKDKSESRVTAEFYNCAIEVMRSAEAIDQYASLPQQEAFDIEYWLLEEAKLRRMPPEQEFARKVVVILGAGSGIGREVAHRLSKEGAHIVSVDLNAEAAQNTAREIATQRGSGIGVAGTGLSATGPALGLAADITDRKSIRSLLDQIALAYGGIDAIAITAGIFVPPDTTGHIPDDKWPLTFAINVTGAYFVVDEAASTIREQALPVNIVIATSANAVVAKKGSLAYDTSKAAANHLVRELAIELAPLARVNGVAPATVVQGSAMFPRDRVLASLAKYEIPYTEEESTESLTGKLAAFYAQRTLTKVPITPADQAEAFYILLSDRLSKTTGQILTVDGGLHEAFLR
ncbi:MAG: bifunctional rhamnulose-1-phosphate aldolase/short-chain dehydrogenase [Verrucomicrobia bacterium]|nr:MAG: bifunctional rhamnulose-1-phosphate aldolase/short-chain dehydrogenase [Verrucomicrobiota bacterium]